LEERSALIEHLKRDEILAVFHYQSLHKSPYFRSEYQGAELPNADRYTDCLARLPLFFELSNDDVDRVSASVLAFYGLH